MNSSESETNDSVPTERDTGQQETLSAEQLSHAFAQLMSEPDEKPNANQSEADGDNDETVSRKSSQDTIVSPMSILEAMLFVGHPENQPLTNRLLASFMRGVAPEEVDEMVVKLNEQYGIDGAAYHIASSGPGYQMTLRNDFESVRNRFYGRIREARLSQSAIEILSIIAYRQPIERKIIDDLRGKPCGGILNQLVRRDLLTVERTDERPRKTIYRTTERFLDLFKITSIEDLPRGDDFE